MLGEQLDRLSSTDAGLVGNGKEGGGKQGWRHTTNTCSFQKEINQI
jgi:hypothetical protein